MFKSIFMHSSIGLATVGLDGKFILANPYLCNLLGYTAEELSNKTFSDITHPDDLSKNLALWARLKSKEITFYEIEKRYIHKDGHFIWILLIATTVLDNNQNITHYIAQVKDISRERELEEELEKHKELELKRLIALNLQAKEYLQKEYFCGKCYKNKKES